MRERRSRGHNGLGFLLWIALLIFISHTHVQASGDPIVELTVTKGDLLINICKKYLENPRGWLEIATLNSLKNPDRIYPGQRLLIPVRLLRGIPLTCEVTFLKGDVRVRKESAGTWTALRIGDRVTQGSSVQTGRESATELTFEDGATFFLRPDTLLEVEMAQRKGPVHILRDFFIDIGTVLTRIRGATGTDSRHKIRTPSAVASARGTEFRVSVDSGGSTRSEVLKGIIEVGAMNQYVELQEEEGTWVKRGEPPMPPRRLLPPPMPFDLKPIYKQIPFQITFEQIEDSPLSRVMVALDRENKDTLQEKVIRTGGTMEISGLRDGVYYLVTQSIDRAGLEGPPSEPFVLKVRVNPLPPFIQLPPNDAEFRERSIEVRWLKVEDAASYDIQVAEDREFTILREERAGVREEFYKTGDLDYKTYYFRVKSAAVDGYEGDWSPVVRFVVIPPPPSPPLEKPETGEKTIHLRWRPLEGIKIFHFQMATDREFKEVVIDERVDQANILVPKPEVPGFYYVRTSSIDSKGYEGEFSMPQSFEIKPPLPPSLQKPGVSPTAVQIRWSSVAEGMNYHLQMAGDEQFQAVLLDQKTDQLGIVLKRPGPGIYYVRASSINSKGYEGEFSKPQSFEVNPPLPPHLEKPEVDKKTIRFRWSLSQEEVSYHLQLAREETFKTILADQKILTTSIDLKQPDAPGIYYVRVSSVDADGNEGEFSTPERIEIKAKFPYTGFGVGAGILAAIGLILLLGL